MNMDDTPCYFDMLFSATFDLKGIKTVKIKTNGNEKLRFTALLTAQECVRSMTIMKLKHCHQ